MTMADRYGPAAGSIPAARRAWLLALTYAVAFVLQATYSVLMAQHVLRTSEPWWFLVPAAAMVLVTAVASRGRPLRIRNVVRSALWGWAAFALCFYVLHLIPIGYENAEGFASGLIGLTVFFFVGTYEAWVAFALSMIAAATAMKLDAQR